MTGAETEKLASHLIEAQSEAQVDKIIEMFPALGKRENWVPYGGQSINWDRIGNQQAEPTSALTEKIINAIDAMLMSKCTEAGYSLTGKDAPQTMHEACERLFGVPQGRIGNLTKTERTKMARNIQVVVTGSKKTPCYAVIDQGEGQSPSSMPETILSLSRENKELIPFVQGKYNMGGTGALVFCGQKWYQAVISRKQPGAPGRDEGWAVTLVRRSHIQGKLPVLEYFAPGGKIASFHADFLNLLPSASDLNSEPLDHGTYIKLFDYNIGSTYRSVDMGLYEAACHTMYSACLPIRFFDDRVAKGKTKARTFDGLDVILDAEGAGVVHKAYSLELDLGEIGKLPVAAIPIIDKERWPGPRSVIFVINGQTHSSLPMTFLNKCNLPWLRKKLLVVVDCTDMNEAYSPIIFMASRDRMRSGTREGELLIDRLREALSKHEGLRELNREIHEQLSLETAKDKSQIVDLFEHLIKSDSNMAQLFGLGSILKAVGSGHGKHEKYQGQVFPTFLKPIQGLTKDQPKAVPVNRPRKIVAETDAANNYLIRSRQPGKIVHSPEHIRTTVSLADGRATIFLEVPDNSNIGDTFPAFIGFQDAQNVEPIGFHFDLTVSPREETSQKPKPQPKPTKTNKEDKPKHTLPKVTPVYEGEPAYEQFQMDAKTGLEIIEEAGLIEVFVNMSNMYLQNELLANKRPEENDILNMQYMWGLALTGIALWREFRTSDKIEDPQDHVRQCTSAVSQIILSTIRRIGGISPEAIPAE